MNTETDELIVQSVLRHVNAWTDKPCAIGLEKLDKAPHGFSMSIQQLSGTVVLKKFIDGSYVGAWPFAVYVRISGADTGKRIDAVCNLERFGAWLCGESALPDIGSSRTADSFEMTSLPSIAAQYEDGGVDYQAVFRLNYRQRSA